MTDDELYNEYLPILLDKKKTYCKDLFGNKSENEKEAIALALLKLIFEKTLNWTPEQVEHELNAEILDRLKLTPMIRYIKFPYTFSKKTDCYLIAKKIYSKNHEIDEVDLAKDVYSRVMSGQMSRYPNKYFDNLEGYRRALFTLRYALNKNKTFGDFEELFKFMYEKGESFLKSVKLYDAYSLYFNNPIDFLYEAIPKKQKEECKEIYEKYKNIEKNKNKEIEKAEETQKT